MPIKPGKDESQSEWMARCVPEMMGQNGGTKRPNEQAVAACMTMWRDKEKSMKKNGNGDVDPDDYDDREGFMVDCTGAGGDEDSCAMRWDERRAKHVVHKTHVSEGDGGLEFILSDATPDRMGDVIEASGWELANFKRNPVALFNHNAGFPIGKWTNLRTDGGELRGHLQLAPKGTSDRIDEIRKLVEAGILRAVSVGFLPRASEPLTKDGMGGSRFTRSELVETSLVAIPANPNALAVARSLNISRDTVAMVFAGKGNTERPAQRASRFQRRACRYQTEQEDTHHGSAFKAYRGYATAHCCAARPAQRAS